VRPQRPFPRPGKIRRARSGHEEADEACDTEEKEDNDCAINRAKPASSEWLARDERSIKNTTLPAHVVSNPSHAMMFSMARATGNRRGMNKKMTRKRRGRQGVVLGFDIENCAVAPVSSRLSKNRRRRLNIGEPDVSGLGGFACHTGIVPRWWKEKLF